MTPGLNYIMTSLVSSAVTGPEILLIGMGLLLTIGILVFFIVILTRKDDKDVDQQP
jgi:hypothetical protein